MTRRNTALLLVGAIMAVAIVVWTRGSGFGETSQAVSLGYIRDWKDGLALTQEQLKDFRQILREYRVQNGFIQSDYERLMALNRNLFESEDYDSDYYTQESFLLEARRLEIEKDFFEKVHALLTPSQRKVFGDNMSEWSIKR